MSRPHPIVYHPGHIAMLLAGHKVIKQDWQVADEGLCNGARPSLGHDGVGCCHPVWHVVHKAIDDDLHARWVVSASHKPQSSLLIQIKSGHLLQAEHASCLCM